MNLVIERYKKTSQYTLSRVYDASFRRLFMLDIIEPPLSGLAEPGTPLLALNPDHYRLFLKGDIEECDLIAVFRKVYRRPRYGFVRTKEKILLTRNIDFSYSNSYIKAPLWTGKYDPANHVLLPNEESFNRFMVRLFIAKQKAEVINVIVK